MKEKQEIIKALDYLHSCCETISEGGACERCPILGNCLELTALSDVAEDMTAGDWDKFIGFADDVYKSMEESMNEEDYEAYYADVARKGERDERYFDELYGY